ncbi:unnamed protein product [Parnassius mnemosyne]|uniref:RNA-directed DNA polymerase n=1 Tax=Parnassius mnemosyne TaxID=213953 RepID=A0AAV1LQV1_9NEOP
MPFGLKNRPATFQRLMDRFRSGGTLKDTVVLAYLGDILVISEGNLDVHMKDLQLVFDRLRQFGLRANREKCSFACTEVNYLGHLLTPEGIKPDETKIQAILTMKEPTNVKQLKTFLQTWAWFRKFVQNFSGIAQPLTKLTRIHAPWSWAEDQRKAFEELKIKLTSSPILIQADYSLPFLVRTDASNYALGAALMQVQGEHPDERVIEYASRLLTPAEQRYSTTEREALAVVWAVEKFRPYIEGHPVIVKSDHQPLKWLLTLKSPSGRLVRWALRLQPYDIRFEYTPGKANVIADTLSRPVHDDSNACSTCSVTIDVPRVSLTELRASQLADPEIKKIIILDYLRIENTDILISSRWLERGYLMSQGFLYRLSPESDAEEPQLVIPATMRTSILQEVHDVPTAGHQGLERTLQRLKQRYYFTSMRKFVTKYLKNCEECQRYKISNQKPAGLLQTPVQNQRGEVLAIDFFGPLPEGESGEKWSLLIEDTATRWVEMFALKEATAEVIAKILIEQYFLRYGFPRRIVSDNGVQFVSAVMQQTMHLLDTKQNLITRKRTRPNEKTEISKPNFRFWSRTIIERGLSICPKLDFL